MRNVTVQNEKLSTEEKLRRDNFSIPLMRFWRVYRKGERNEGEKGRDGVR